MLGKQPKRRRRLQNIVDRVRLNFNRNRLLRSEPDLRQSNGGTVGQTNGWIEKSTNMPDNFFFMWSILVTLG